MQGKQIPDIHAVGLRQKFECRPIHLQGIGIEKDSRSRPSGSATTPNRPGENFSYGCVCVTPNYLNVERLVRLSKGVQSLIMRGIALVENEVLESRTDVERAFGRPRQCF